MTARRESRASTPQLPVRTTEQLKASLRNPEQDSTETGELRSSEQDRNGLTNAERLAAELLDEAFEEAHLRNQEIAHLTGVSETMVIKWRSATSRGCPSFIQMLLLPPQFHWELHKAMNRRKQFAFGKQALIELLDAAGSLAALVP